MKTSKSDFAKMFAKPSTVPIDFEKYLEKKYNNWYFIIILYVCGL